MNSDIRQYSSKQMGDACEMLVAAGLTLAGIPALKVPDLWPEYDVIAQPKGMAPQRISVKSRTYKAGAAFVRYDSEDIFDWLAIVILQGEVRKIYLLPRSVADKLSRRNAPNTKTANGRYWRIEEVHRKLAKYENNFGLNET